eukprot:gene6403-6634_t
MTQFMFYQARGLPMGAHAPFKDFMVDAATLRALTKIQSGAYDGPRGFTAVGNKAAAGGDSTATEQPHDVIGFDPALTQLCDVLELVLRSCSVLIERFHHSLFLYVLTGLDKYVSVERYIGPLVALIAVLLLQAASAVCPLQRQDNQPPLSFKERVQHRLGTIAGKLKALAGRKQSLGQSQLHGVSTDQGLEAANANFVHITSCSNEQVAARNLVENMPSRGQTVIRVAGPHATETAVLAVALARPMMQKRWGQDLAVCVLWGENNAYKGKQTGLLLSVFRCSLGSFPPQV